MQSFKSEFNKSPGTKWKIKNFRLILLVLCSVCSSAWKNCQHGWLYWGRRFVPPIHLLMRLVPKINISINTILSIIDAKQISCKKCSKEEKKEAFCWYWWFTQFCPEFREGCDFASHHMVVGPFKTIMSV